LICCGFNRPLHEERICFNPFLDEIARSHWPGESPPKGKQPRWSSDDSALQN
jgi:hypothetical protein